jgi:hypothetical protein
MDIAGDRSSTVVYDYAEADNRTNLIDSRTDFQSKAHTIIMQPSRLYMVSPAEKRRRHQCINPCTEVVFVFSVYCMETLLY